MSNHTPGPWRIGKNFGSVVCDTPVPGIRGSDHTEYYGGHLIAESVTKANANLIAAAPDLLEVLEAIRRYPKIRAYLGSELTDKADAAISKARGEK